MSSEWRTLSEINDMSSSIDIIHETNIRINAAEIDNRLTIPNGIGG